MLNGSVDRRLLGGRKRRHGAYRATLRSLTMKEKLLKRFEEEVARSSVS